MSEPQLIWGESHRRVIKDEPLYAAVDWPKYRRSRRGKEKFAYAPDDLGRSGSSVGSVKSNGLRQVEAVFYCHGTHGCPGYERAPKLYPTFEMAMWWVQWRFEACCAKQVEALLSRDEPEMAGG